MDRRTDGRTHHAFPARGQACDLGSFPRQPHPATLAHGIAESGSRPNGPLLACWVARVAPYGGRGGAAEDGRRAPPASAWRCASRLAGRSRDFASKSSGYRARTDGRTQAEVKIIQSLVCMYLYRPSCQVENIARGCECACVARGELRSRFLSVQRLLLV